MAFKYHRDQNTMRQFNEEMHRKLNIASDAPHIYFWKPYPKVPGTIGPNVACNWWKEAFFYRDIKFRTGEHAMMWAKADLFKDEEQKANIRDCIEPWDAKEAGRMVKNFNDQIWEENSYQILLDIVYAKFTQNKALKKWILKQDPNAVFVEASPLDYIWGVKMAEEHPDIGDYRQWRGYNLLGYVTTEVMRRIQQENA